MALPRERHGLKAIEDSAVLLTAVTEVPEEERGGTEAAARG